MAPPSRRSSRHWKGSRENKGAPIGSLCAPLPPQRRGKRISRHFSLPCASGGGGPHQRWWGRKRKRCTKITAAPAGAGVPLPVQVQMNKEAARPPSVYVRTQSPKHGIDTPCEENSNTTPAPRLGIGGPCRRADERGAGGRDRHYTSPCKTQWPKPPTASLNAQGTDADCAVQHPAADTRCVNAPSARTFPNTKTRFRPLIICTLSPPPAGVRHNGEPPASAGAAEIKKDAHTGVFFLEQFFL